jgi:hypothetical protein
MGAGSPASSKLSLGKSAAGVDDDRRGSDDVQAHQRRPKLSRSRGLGLRGEVAGGVFTTLDAAA